MAATIYHGIECFRWWPIMLVLLLKRMEEDTTLKGWLPLTMPIYSMFTSLMKLYRDIEKFWKFLCGKYQEQLSNKTTERFLFIAFENILPNRSKPWQFLLGGVFEFYQRLSVSSSTRDGTEMRKVSVSLRHRHWPIFVPSGSP